MVDEGSYMKDALNPGIFHGILNLVWDQHLPPSSICSPINGNIMGVRGNTALRNTLGISWKRTASPGLSSPGGMSQSRVIAGAPGADSPTAGGRFYDTQFSSDRNYHFPAPKYSDSDN